jgi:hypothetical protein
VYSRKNGFFEKIENFENFSQTLVSCVLEKLSTSTGDCEIEFSKKFLYKNFEIVSTYVSFEIMSFQRLYPVVRKMKQQLRAHMYHELTDFET